MIASNNVSVSDKALQRLRPTCVRDMPVPVPTAGSDSSLRSAARGDLVISTRLDFSLDCHAFAVASSISLYIQESPQDPTVMDFQ